jgi:hypothetical protein
VEESFLDSGRGFSFEVLNLMDDSGRWIEGVKG